MPDPDVFRFAVAQGLTILTFNVRDFMPPASEALRSGQPFPGLIVSEHLTFKETLRRLTRVLGERPTAELENAIVWPGQYG